MTYDNDSLNWIYDRTDGYCHICGKKLSFINYARYGSKGAWEVEHSKPISMGGTEHRNNLYPACINCNRRKALQTSRRARAQHGRSRAPYSRLRKEQIRRSNALKGGAVGGAIGSIAGGLGSIIGAAIGAKIGHSIDPND